MDNSKTVKELEIEFLNLKIENEQKISAATRILHEATLETEKRVRIVFVFMLPGFAVIGIIMKALNWA